MLRYPSPTFIPCCRADLLLHLVWLHAGNHTAPVQLVGWTFFQGLDSLGGDVAWSWQHANDPGKLVSDGSLVQVGSVLGVSVYQYKPWYDLAYFYYGMHLNVKYGDMCYGCIRAECVQVAMYMLGMLHRLTALFFCLCHLKRSYRAPSSFPCQHTPILPLSPLEANIGYPYPTTGASVTPLLHVLMPVVLLFQL